MANERADLLDHEICLQRRSEAQMGQAAIATSSATDFEAPLPDRTR